MPETTDVVVVVSNKGRVKRLGHRRWNIKNQTYSFYKEKEYCYSTNRGKQRHEDPCAKRQKYIHVDFQGRAHSIHRLVAKAFLPNPHNLPQVHHKDENRSNNNLENLEWVTNLENQKKVSKKWRLARLKKLIKFSKEEAKTALKERILGFSTTRLTQKYKVSYETIRFRTNKIASAKQKQQIKAIQRENATKNRIKTMRKRGMIR
jgi:hypothetical protein